MKTYGVTYAIINNNTLKLFRCKSPIIGSRKYCKNKLYQLKWTKNLKIVKLDLLGPDEYELAWIKVH